MAAGLVLAGSLSYPNSARGGSAAIFARQDSPRVHGAGPPRLLSRAKTVRFEAGKAPAAVEKAGAVSNAIPAETVQRQGQGPSVPLNVSNEVDWNDLVQTFDTGRVRISLLDGSFLNIGARSTMRIVMHNPQSQQTQVIMTLGHMRGEVIKLTKPGASFQVQTQTAVIGVVGTIFLIEALPNLTRVYCLEGLVTVRNINAAIAGEVTLHPGESTTVRRDLPPTAAVLENTASLQSEESQSEIQPTMTRAGAPPAAPVRSLTGTTRLAAMATAGTLATAAVFSGLANSKAGQAHDASLQAVSTANAALVSATNAAAAAAQAAASLNPPPPSCGCQ